MRILPLFVLPRVADAADCTSNIASATDANPTATGQFLIDGASFGCEGKTGVTAADSFPTEHDLKITDGKWVDTDDNNYKPVKAYAYTKTKGDATTELTTGANFYWHLHGEQLKGAQNKNICYCGNRGTGPVRGRGNWKDTTFSDGANVAGGKIVFVDTDADDNSTGNVGDGTAAAKICLCKQDGSGPDQTKINLVTDTTTKLLVHGEVGDAATGTKMCANLLWTFDATNKPQADQCTDKQICDQFGGTKACVDKTEQLYNTKTTYTQATATKKYCIRRVKGSPDDTSFGTYAASDQKEYRPVDAADISNPACTEKYYCNPYTTTGADRCLDSAKVLGDDNVASAVRMKGKTGEVCLGVGEAGSSACSADHHCNPHADTNANLCVKKATVLNHAEAGDPDVTPDPKTTCIADNALHKACAKTEICNYGAGVAADVCLPNTKLIGAPTIAKGNNWNAIKFKSLRVQPAKNTELCIARAFSEASFSTTTPGGKSFSKQCSESTKADEAEICNPNATALADVCVKKNIVVVKHGDQVDAASTPPRVACIGDTHYKLSLAKDTICNFNAASVDDVEVLLADTLSGSVDADKNVIAGGFNKVGEKTTGELNKWCFDQKQAARCTDKQTCNPAGTYADDAWTAGTDEKATCVDTEKLIEHGAKGDDTKIFCLGSTGASKYTVDADAETPVDQCSRDNGKLYKADEQLADGALVDADTLAAGGVRCFATSGGSFYDASCKENYACNPTGSSKDDCGTEDKACSLSNICVFKDARLTVGGKFDKEAAPTVNICLAGAVATECTEAKPYCQEDGTCAETAASGTDEGGEGENDNASGSSTASLVGLSVAAILSA